MIGMLSAYGQTLKHSYTFEDGTAKDVVGSVDGQVRGDKISFSDGKCIVHLKHISNQVLIGNQIVHIIKNEFLEIWFEFIDIEIIFWAYQVLDLSFEVLISGIENIPVVQVFQIWKNLFLKEGGASFRKSYVKGYHMLDCHWKGEAA